jgi:hypothetical protein
VDVLGARWDGIDDAISSIGQVEPLSGGLSECGYIV